MLARRRQTVTSHDELNKNFNGKKNKMSHLYRDAIRHNSRRMPRK